MKKCNSHHISGIESSTSEREPKLLCMYCAIESGHIKVSLNILPISGLTKVTPVRV